LQFLEKLLLQFDFFTTADRSGIRTDPTTPVSLAGAIRGGRTDRLSDLIFDFTKNYDRSNTDY
jgi:hypothetical protein